ncbi:MAG: hypothetical protein IRZ03_12710 [Acidobacterium ailaaui]|jgi:hypothetical protein|nr:hypothetical protein [Pseudacidobacterium ailaaui]
MTTRQDHPWGRYLSDLYWRGTIDKIQSIADPLHNRTPEERAWLFETGSQLMEEWIKHVPLDGATQVFWSPKVSLSLVEQELLGLAARCWLALLLDGQEEEWGTYESRVLWRPLPWIVWNSVVSSSLLSSLLLNMAVSEVWVSTLKMLADPLVRGKPLPIPQTQEERRQRLEIIVAVGVRLLLSLQQPQRLQMVERELHALQNASLLVMPDEKQRVPPGILERIALAKALRMVGYLLTPPVYPSWPQILDRIRILASVALHPTRNQEHADLAYLLLSSSVLVSRVMSQHLQRLEIFAQLHHSSITGGEHVS